MVGGTIPQFGVPNFNQAAPFKAVLFGKNGASRGKLEKVISDCGYCGDTFGKGTSATYDHIRPDSAGGDNSVTNGILACQPCNNDRSNVPLLEYLQGYDGSYVYTSNGNHAKRTSLMVRPKKMADQRKQAFSNYLKQFVTKNIQVENQEWFSSALDNMLYPIWGDGKKPGAITPDIVNNRTKVLIEILSDADAKFWLSPTFESMVQTQFDLTPEKRGALLYAISQIRQDRKTVQGQGTIFDKITNGLNPFIPQKRAETVL